MRTASRWLQRGLLGRALRSAADTVTPVRAELAIGTANVDQPNEVWFYLEPRWAELHGREAHDVEVVGEFAVNGIFVVRLADGRLVHPHSPPTCKGHPLSHR